MSEVVCLIPAHNEEVCLPDALHSLVKQTRRPDRVVVVADNCTDRTVEVTEPYRTGFCVEVFETAGNRHKKAGALNQVLGEELARLPEGSYVLVMDADSVLDPDFVEKALEALGNGAGVVGGVFLAGRQTSLVERLQALEYARYAREVARGKGKARVLTGTASLFPAPVLRRIYGARESGRLPGPPGYYNTDSITEDGCITYAVKHLGYACVSPKGCLVETDVMETWADLWKQRVRWQRGALSDLWRYGPTRVTAPYALRQFMTHLGVLAMASLLLLTALCALTGTLSFSPLWAGLGALLYAERVLTARRAGRGGVLLAALVLPEMLYDLFLSVCYLRAAWLELSKGEYFWGDEEKEAS